MAVKWVSLFCGQRQHLKTPPPGDPGWASPWNMIFPAVLWRCRLGNRKGIQPLKSWVLVCWWQQYDWSFAPLVAPFVTNTIILAPIKSRMVAVWYQLPSVVLENGRQTSVVVVGMQVTSTCALTGQQRAMIVDSCCRCLMTLTRRSSCSFSALVLVALDWTCRRPILSSYLIRTGTHTRFGALLFIMLLTWINGLYLFH